MAKDISAVGAVVEIKYGDKTITIDEFSDEGTPFDAPDIDVSTNAKNLNGEMISSRTPSVVPFSITVIPGSIADAWLHNKLAKSLLMPLGKGGVGTANSNVGDSDYAIITVTIPQSFQASGNVSSNAGGNFAPAMVYTYTNCRLKSGPTGPSTSAEGRMSARTYQFEAEGVSVSSR